MAARPDYMGPGTESGNLVPLSDLDDVGVAEGDADPRGWDVICADGMQVGAVDELIVDTGLSRVRFLDVDLDEEALHLNDSDRHILLPVGHVALDRDNNHVLLQELSCDQIVGWRGFSGRATADRLRTSQVLPPDEVITGPRGVAPPPPPPPETATPRPGVPPAMRPSPPPERTTELTGDRAVHIPIAEERAIEERRPETREAFALRKRGTPRREDMDPAARDERVGIDREGRIVDSRVERRDDDERSS